MVNRKINSAWTWWIWGEWIKDTWWRGSKTEMRMKMNGWTIDESIEEVSTSKKSYIKGLIAMINLKHPLSVWTEPFRPTMHRRNTEKSSEFNLTELGSKFVFSIFFRKTRFDNSVIVTTSWWRMLETRGVDENCKMLFHHDFTVKSSSSRLIFLNLCTCFTGCFWFNWFSWLKFWTVDYFFCINFVFFNYDETVSDLIWCLRTNCEVQVIKGHFDVVRKVTVVEKPCTLQPVLTLCSKYHWNCFF